MNPRLSLLGKIWIPPKAKSLEELRKLRGIEEVDYFACEDLKDLEKAMKRIEEAIAKEERILIVGDYDADGITASVILFRALRNLNAKVSVRLPHRLHHGYGLNREFVEEAKSLGVGLIITVDNGISAYEEVKLANKLGIDVVITDHHLPPPKLPSAFAIVNPRREDCAYANKLISGSGVALKLALALLTNSKSERKEDFEKLKDEFLVLAMIGTLADVCELRGENRKIVSEGLKKIGKTEIPGLRRILHNAGLREKISAEDVAFRIAPRINAAGRIGNPLIAFKALTDACGVEEADELERLNEKRQNLTKQSLEEAEERLGEIGEEKILVVSGKNLHLGIIGLVAGKLSEKYNRPSIVMSEVENACVGSCRSPLVNFNITQALRENEDLLEKFGGHRAAAGFTLLQKNREAFEKNILAIAREAIKEEELIPSLQVDLEVEEEELHQALFEEIAKLQPFGEGNPPPLLHLKNTSLNEIRKIGNGGNHLRVKVGKQNLNGVGFGLGEFERDLMKQKKLNLLFHLEENSWNGNTSLQLRLIDLS